MATTCSTCGTALDAGWMRRATVPFNGSYAFRETDMLYCDEHMSDAGEDACEFRTCDSCHKTMTSGFTADGGVFYCCEECFEGVMNADYPYGWRENSHDDDPCWEDGYYDYKDESGAWHDTAIYYTEWF